MSATDRPSADPAGSAGGAGELSDAGLDALLLGAISQRTYSYDTLTRMGPTTLPAGAGVSPERLVASVERLVAAGCVDWYRDGTWLAASQAGRRRNLEQRHIDLVDIDLRPGAGDDEVIVLDDADRPAEVGHAGTDEVGES